MPNYTIKTDVGFDAANLAKNVAPTTNKFSANDIKNTYADTIDTSVLINLVEHAHLSPEEKERFAEKLKTVNITTEDLYNFLIEEGHSPDVVRLLLASAAKPVKMTQSVIIESSFYEDYLKNKFGDNDTKFQLLCDIFFMYNNDPLYKKQPPYNGDENMKEIIHNLAHDFVVSTSLTTIFTENFDQFIDEMKTKNFETGNITWDNITKFKKEDFTCKCGCQQNNMDLKLVRLAEDISDYFGQNVVITCGSRCQKHNDSLPGSSPNSLHIQGKAIDFYVEGIPKSEVLKRTHELVSTGKARFTYTNDTNMGNAVHMDIY